MDRGSAADGSWRGPPRGHDWWQAVLEGSSITLAGCDADHRYVWVLNPPRNFTIEQILGRSDSEILPPADVAELIELKAEVLASGRGVRREVRVTALDEVRYFDVTAKPVRDAGGGIGGLTLAAVEVTELRRLGIEGHLALEQERAARAAAELRRSEAERQIASRSKLMRGFSHEVRNPLSAALGYVELVMAGVQGSLTEGQRFYLSRARRLLDTAVGLLDDLLMLARAEAGGLTVHRAPADLRATLREVAEWYREQADDAGLELQLELPDTLPAIETDAARVRQIVGNLLSNALKYTERGAVGIRVLHGERADGPGPGPWIVVDVWDTGPGIPDEEYERIFDEFTRLESDAAGFGLGLAVSRMLARALGGEVTMRSRVGVGSTFTLWLPAVEPGRAGLS
ncbi:MAG TPA: PAS domain-containing sensor histidine kinase [Longimicrobiales bacterium]